MKFLHLATAAALSIFGSVYASNAQVTIEELARKMEMPELFSVYDENVLDWFHERSHITSKSLFHGILASELKNTASILRVNHDFAKYCLRSYLSSESFELDFYNSDSVRNCVMILVENNEFESLFELTIKFGDKFINVMDSVELPHMSSLIDALMISPQRDHFFEVLMGSKVVNLFKVQIFAALILSDVSEEFYIENLLSDDQLFRYSISFVAEKFIATNADDPIMDKIERICEKAEFPEFIQTFPEFDLCKRILRSESNVTLKQLDINVAHMSFKTKHALIRIAGLHGKDVLFNELFDTLSDEEKFNVLETSLRISYSTLPEFKFASKVYNLLTEDVRAPIHKSEDYILAAVSWLKLERIELLCSRNHYRITFRADAEQISAGCLDEMVYYEGLDLKEFFRLLPKLKFNSAAVFKNFIYQFCRIIPSEITREGVPVSKETMKLIASSESLQIFLFNYHYKLRFEYYSDFAKFIEETPLENISNMRNIFYSNYINDINLIGLFNSSENLAKLEKFCGKNMIDIITPIISDLGKSGFQEKHYFAIRNALLYAMNGKMGNYFDLEFRSSLQNIVFKDFPETINDLALNLVY